MEATPKPKTFAELFEERKKYILKQGLPAGQSGLYIRTSVRPLSNTSKKSIQKSNQLRRRTLRKDLEDESIMVSEAIYMIGLYSGDYTKPYHIDDNTKINDIIKALQNFKSKTKTNSKC